MTIPTVPLVLIVLTLFSLALGQDPNKKFSWLALALGVLVLVTYFGNVTPEMIASVRGE
jgi:hypothetical protein